MDKRFKKSLPLIAVIGALVAATGIIVTSGGRQTLLTDTGETRQTVERTTLAELQALHPHSIENPSFRQAITQAQDAPYVAVVWLFTPDGQVLEGNRAVSQNSTVKESATDEMRRVLGMLPAGTLSAEQRVALLAASTMQKEGEHNNVYRHLLREIHSPDGRLVALVGVTYDVNPAIGAPGATYVLFLLAWLLGMGVYWLSLPVWVWLDARERGERAWVWAVFVLLGNLVALIAYILARVPRQQPALVD
jgi:hypothetical protein